LNSATGYLNWLLLLIWIAGCRCCYARREVGRRAGVPVQEFCVRNDMPCGSTIGPILAHNLGCRTVDVGMPQLSMHSIREMCGVDDVLLAYKHFLAFFRCVASLGMLLVARSADPSASFRSVDGGHKAMHSIREMRGVNYVLLAFKHFLAFFRCVASLGMLFMVVLLFQVLP
jgi:aspartyl aminopeptidase